MWPKRGTGGTQGESSSGIKVPLPPRSALTLIISKRQNDNVLYSYWCCCCSCFCVVRARSCRKPMYKSLEFIWRGRARTRANVRESASEMWSSAEPAPAPASASASAPASIYKPGLCTNGRPTHLVTVKVLPLSLSSHPFFSLSLSLTRAQRSALLCSACVCLCVRVPVCVSARVCEELLVPVCLPACESACVSRLLIAHRQTECRLSKYPVGCFEKLNMQEIIN